MHILYPNGYTTRDNNDERVSVSKGDESVTVLFESAMRSTVNVESWKFRRQVLSCAVRLFGNAENWFRDQFSNPRITGYNKQFLEDTYQFIQTGRRSLSLQNWTDLVVECEDVSTPLRFNTPGSDFKLTAEEKSGRLIQIWVTQPNGMLDLLYSMQLLFGLKR